jgi:hypothetical protein
MREDERVQLRQALAEAPDFEGHHRLLYQHFSRHIYGMDVPMPHFYLGTNKSGDLKWRSPMPIALTGGDSSRQPIRMYYTPYPTLMMTRETLQEIISDLAFGSRFASVKTDYSGQYTPELAERQYERFLQLSADPETTVGLSRRLEDK